MIKTTTFVRKPFPVQAVQVTTENMNEIAEWCNGEIRNLGEHDGRWGPFVEVDVINPLRPRQAQAFVGDWVLQSEKGFKVYTRSAFEKCFDSAEDCRRVVDDIVRKETKVLIDRVAEANKTNDGPITAIYGVVVSTTGSAA